MRRSSLGCSRREALQIGGFTGMVAVAGCLTPASQANSCSDGTDLSLVEATDAHVSNEFSTPVDGWIESRGEEDRVKQVRAAFGPRWVHEALQPSVDASDMLSSNVN